ncbi:hypothetical protein Tco_0267229 [Tanacetum coccineum]
MYQSRETNPHFQPRTQRYAQAHDPDDPTVPLALPHRFRPSPPHQSSPPVGPNVPHSQEPNSHLPIFSPSPTPTSHAPVYVPPKGPLHLRPPTTTHHDPGVSHHPTPHRGSLPHSQPTPSTHHTPGVSHHPTPHPEGLPHSRPTPTTHHTSGVSHHPTPHPGGLPHSRPTPTSHHGTNASHYASPPLRVPPPRKTKGLTWLVAICCVLFWIIIILGGLILLIIYLAYRPHYPKFDISSASLNVAYLDLGYLLNGDMTLLANFTNPNKKVNVEFRYMVVNLYFEGTLIAAKYVEPLSVSPRGYKLRDVHMVSSQVPFSRKHIAALNEQIRTDRIVFEAKSSLRTTSNLGGFFRYSYWLHGHCKFAVSGPPSGVLVAKSCVTKR